MDFSCSSRRARACLAALAVVVATGCSSTKKSHTALPPPATTTTTSTPARPLTSTTAPASPTTTVKKAASTTRPHTLPPLPGVNLTIVDFAFDPSTVVIAKPGSPVTVLNNGTQRHTVTADNGEFDSGPIVPRVSYSFLAPPTPGSYAFHCSIHAQMHGTLVVQPRS